MSTTNSQQSLPCGQGSDYTLPLCESDCPFSRDFFVKTCTIRNMNLTQHSDNQSWTGTLPVMCQPPRPAIDQLLRPLIPTFDSAPPTYVSSVPSLPPITPQPPRPARRVIKIRPMQGPSAYPPWYDHNQRYSLPVDRFPPPPRCDTPVSRFVTRLLASPVPTPAKPANPPIDTPWDPLPNGIQPAFIHNDPSLHYQHSFTSSTTDVDRSSPPVSPSPVDRSSPQLSLSSEDTFYPDSVDTTASQHSFTSDEAFLADEETTSLIIHRPECPQPPPNTPESTPPPTQQPQPSFLQRCWRWVKSFFT